MRDRWKDALHLIAPAGVFVAGLLLFLAVRSVVVPPSFGRYGHYRAAALDEIRARPLQYAGRAACANCHAVEATTLGQGRHAPVSCEACHGPAAAHVEDPGATKPLRPDAAALCAGCHEADAAKPPWFRQVNTKEHMAGMACGDCHQPHSPAP
ncbi:MAG: cytochrome c3 family protein [Bryobacteraceae bacterium]